MVRNFLNGDDSNSTQLEGKKLKDRGAVLAEKNGRQLEIEVDDPALEEQIGEGSEYFAPIEYVSGEKENFRDREERQRREQETIRLQTKQQTDKQAQARKKIDPNQKLDKIEQGIANSQNDGAPTHEAKGVNLSSEQQQNLNNSQSAGNVGNNKGGGPGLGA